MMKTSPWVYTAASVAAMLAALSSPASAEVTFEWVTVGNPGNAADPLNEGDVPGIGSVANTYRIAKHEVTTEQYAEFLNAVAADDTNNLYDIGMSHPNFGGITQSGPSGSFTYSVKVNMGNKPVNNVTFADAMRFVNWLHNGQPSGIQDSSTTEDGAYAISDGVSETRAVDAQFFIPTQNEWYKAAYHQPSTLGGDTDDYWLYPTASNSTPTLATANATGDISNPGTNVANYNFGAQWPALISNVTTVGSAGAGSESHYGTSDQGGNVDEWIERVLTGTSLRGMRGGNFVSLEDRLRSESGVPSGAFASAVIGFRVASPIPPPVPAVSTWGMLIMLVLVVIAGTIVFRRVKVAT